MKIVIGSDHWGVDTKARIGSLLSSAGHEILDVGPRGKEPVDYPDFAHALCRKILDGSCERGILICGTGLGMSMAANRHAGIRAAVCHDPYTARMSRRHNDANVLCLGARVCGEGLIEEIVSAWLETPFEGERHVPRVQKIETQKIETHKIETQKIKTRERT